MLSLAVGTNVRIVLITNLNEIYRIIEILFYVLYVIYSLIQKPIYIFFHLQITTLTKQ